MGEINRDEEQEKAAELWINSNQYNTLILGTGFGKSVVAMLIMEKLFASKVLAENSKILLLTDSEGLRDTNWKEDFEKWDRSWMWDAVTSECYQTVYKWKDTEWDLVIADEFDFSLTEKYSLVYTNNKLKRVLGLTGYVAPDKREILDAIAPSLIEYTTQDAQRDGILNKTQVTFIQFDLSQNKKDIRVEYKKGNKNAHFYQSENDAYEYAENKWNATFGVLSKLKDDPGVVLGSDPMLLAEIKKLEYKLNRLTAQRKEVLLKSIASRQTAKDLINLLLRCDKNKILTFSMLTEQADKINEITYHGKNKKVNFEALRNLSIGTIRSVGVCKAVNRGQNINGLNSLIMESYDGSTTQFNQRHGRGTRLDAGEVMNLYILLPYFHKKIKSPENPGGYSYVRRPTQAVKWAKAMMKGFRLDNPIIIKKGTGENDWRRDTSDP